MAVACSNATTSVPDEPAPQGRAVITAPAETREAVGVSSWTVDDRADYTAVRGYDADGAVIATFAYQAMPGDRANLERANFEATLDARDAHARMRIEADDGQHISVIEDSFRGSAAASAILERIRSDLSTRPPSSAPSLSTKALRPLDIVEAPGQLVDACGAQLIPASAAATKTVTDCGRDPASPACAEGFGHATSPDGSKCCSNAAATAYRYYNRNTSELQRSGQLPIDPGVSPSNSCANFVTATLQQAGFIDWHSNLVSDVKSRLLSLGWTIVPASQARPGDVAIIDGSAHAELVYANDGGKVSLIGSNNANGDGSQRITIQPPYSSAEYLRPPASVCQ